jgi:NitT/TauT family transport system substrate-binding protein
LRRCTTVPPTSATSQRRFWFKRRSRARMPLAVVAEFNNPVYSLVAKPENMTYTDLKGKLIGVAAETGSITISIRKLLALNGLRKDDFRTRFVDGTPARLTCVTVGDCDAVALGQPQDFVAMRRGYRLLGLSTDAVPEYLYTVTAARRSWAVANKDTVVRYVRALSLTSREWNRRSR